MASAMFYHLTRSPAEALLPTLIAKSREAGWRVELRGTDRARMDRLDELLWKGDGFLPHGLAGGPHDSVQPVLLTVAGAQGPATSNDPACVIAIDGAPIRADEVAGLDRLCIVFDGNDMAAVEGARTQWRSLTAAGAAAEYWSEAGGRWERKA